jgi:hypothetical protein
MRRAFLSILLFAGFVAGAFGCSRNYLPDWIKDFRLFPPASLPSPTPSFGDDPRVYGKDGHGPAGSDFRTDDFRPKQK